MIHHRQKKEEEKETTWDCFHVRRKIDVFHDKGIYVGCLQIDLATE